MFILTGYFYIISDYSVLWFVILLFSFDLSMLGYIYNSKIGAYTYNFVHNFALPLLLFLVGFIFEIQWLQGFTLIWMAHIGLDRALGFGLKFESGFKDTHLGRIGK